MAEHRFHVGQVVSLKSQPPDRTAATGFEIVRRLPASANGEWHYRVRGADQVERSVSETQIAPDAAGPTP